MDQEQTTPNTCSIHNLEYIAVDFSPHCKKEARLICLQCLIATPSEKHYVKSLDQAKIHLSDERNVFLQRKQNQSQKNLEIFNKLISSIQSLKIYQNSYLDKILENIKQQEYKIVKGQEELVVQLQNVDVLKFFSSSQQLIQVQYDQIKNIIQTQIQNLKPQDKINNCLELLSEMDDEIIQFAPDIQSNQTESLQQCKSTPSLPIPCKTHQMEIICFDLYQQKAKDFKIACALCVMNKHGQFIDLLSAQKQWFDYEVQQKSLFQSQLDYQRTKIETAQSQFKQVLNKFQLKINEVNVKLAESLITISDKIQSKINKMFKNWLTLSRDEIIIIADTLSKLYHQDTNNKQDQNDFQNDIEEQISVIDDSVRYLINALQESNEIISLAIHSEKTNKDAETQSDIQFRLNQFQIQSNILTVACQQHIKQTKNIAIQNQITIVSESNQNISENYFGGSSKTKLIMYQMLQDELRKQIEQLQMDLSATASFTEVLSQKNKELQEKKHSDNQLYQDKIGLLNQQILNLEKESDKIIEQLNLRLRSLEVEKQQSQMELSDKMKQFSEEKECMFKQLANTKQELENHLLDKQLIVQQLNGEIEKIEQHKQALQIEIQNQQDQIQKQILKEKQEQLKNSQIIINMDEKIQSKQKQIDQLNQQVIILEKEREKNSKISQITVDEYNQQIKQCLLQKQQLEEQSNQLKKIIDEKNSDISKKSIKLNQLQQQKEEETRESKKEIEDGLLQIEELNKQKKELENALQNEQIKISELKIEKTKLEQDKQIQETKNNNLQFELNKQIDSQYLQIKQHIQENQKQKDQLKQSSIQIEELNKQLKEQQNQNNLIKITKDKNIEEKDEQIVQQQQEKNQLQIALNSKNVEIDNIKNNVQNITQELEEKKSIINQLKLKQSQDQQLIQNLNKTIQEYEKYYLIKEEKALLLGRSRTGKSSIFQKVSFGSFTISLTTEPGLILIDSPSFELDNGREDEVLQQFENFLNQQQFSISTIFLLIKFQRIEKMKSDLSDILRYFISLRKQIVLLITLPRSLQDPEVEKKEIRQKFKIFGIDKIEFIKESDTSEQICKTLKNALTGQRGLDLKDTIFEIKPKKQQEDKDLYNQIKQWEQQQAIAYQSRFK